MSRFTFDHQQNIVSSVVLSCFS